MSRTHLVLWLFALGWMAYRARTSAQQWGTTLAALVLLPTFFGTEVERTVLVAGGLLVLLLVPRVHLPRALAAPVTACASASLAIYLTHFALLPLRAHGVPAAVLVPVALALGVATWSLATGVLRRVAVPIRFREHRARRSPQPQEATDVPPFPVRRRSDRRCLTPTPSRLVAGAALAHRRGVPDGDRRRGHGRAAGSVGVAGRATGRRPR